MSQRDLPQNPAPEPDPSTAARQEALRAALQAGTSPEPTREFSTLVERSEPPQSRPEWADDCDCPDRADEWGHGPELAGPIVLGDEFPWHLYNRQARSLSASAGGADSNRDEVQRERDCESANATENERHDSRQDGKK